MGHIRCELCGRCAESRCAAPGAVPELRAHSLVHSNGHLWVFGGRHRKELINKLFSFSLASRQWCEVEVARACVLPLCALWNFDHARVRTSRQEASHPRNALATSASRMVPRCTSLAVSIRYGPALVCAVLWAHASTLRARARSGWPLQRPLSPLAGRTGRTRVPQARRVLGACRLPRRRALGPILPRRLHGRPAPLHLRVRGAHVCA